MLNEKRGQNLSCFVYYRRHFQCCLHSQLSQILLESLPKMNRRPQSDTTNALVRQLTCLLNVETTIRENEGMLTTVKYRPNA